jgi:serine/threonine-protein kinase
LSGSDQARPPHVLDGKYEIGELLGEGGMARVYRAVHLGLGRTVAVKVMKGGAGSDEERARRFEREARLASRLHHPHILSTIDFGRAPGGTLYLVTEFVPGRMLFDLIREEGRLPLSRIFGLFHQVLAAVEEAHAGRVIHRDLKPENILVTDLRSGEDFVKVLDFGIAVIAADVPGGPRPTIGDAVAGTPGYMAPEQILGQPATERSDIYALGVILFELLTGRLPFEDDAPVSLLARQLEHEPPTLARAAPGRIFTPAIERVVARAMARDPADRYAGVAELRQALTAAFAELEPVELSCDACTRPIDPLTGLCGLHGRDERVSALPRMRPTEAQPTLPSMPPGPDTRAGLVRAILGEEELPGDFENAAAAAAGFLLGRGACLELIGEPGSGRTALLEGIGRGAERLGMRLVRAGSDPRLALTPWHPIRGMALGALGLEGWPRTPAALVDAAEALDLDPRRRDGLLALFGFEERPLSGHEIRTAIRRGVIETLVAAAREGAGLCVLADGAGEWDRASAWLARALARLEGAPGLKVVLVSEQGILAPDEARPGIRLPPPAGAGELAAALERLPREALDVLATVAVAGREVPLDLLTAVHGEEEPLLHLGLLERDGWIAVGPDRTVSVAHPLAAEAARERLGAAALRARHLAVGAAFGERAGVFVGARHAAEGGDHERAVELLARAGEAACRAGDEETAGLVHFQRARHVARWELLWGEDEEPYLRLSLEQARALHGSGHRLAAEMVYKEVLTNAGRYPDLAESARKGLESLGAA